MVGVWIWLSLALAQDPTCWDGEFTEELCCNKKFGPKGHEECWDAEHTYERCCGQECDEFFDVERCCDLVKGDQGDEACWAGARSFQSCCAVELSGTISVPELPRFGEGCWDSGRLLTFARCCGTAGPKEDCWQGDFTYARCCLGVTPIPRIYLDLPRTHDLVSCLQESLDGPVKVASNITWEECHGKYLDVSTVVYRMADFELMHDFWWRRGDPKVVRHEEVFGDRGRAVTQPEWLHYIGSLCVPEICSTEAIAGWFSHRTDVGQRYIEPSHRALNETHVRVSPLLARPRRYRNFVGSWLSHRPARDAALRKSQGLNLSYFEFILSQHKPWRELAVSKKTQGVLLALAVPMLLASCLRIIGFQAGASLQDGLASLGRPRWPACDLLRIFTSIVIIATHVKDHYSFPQTQEGHFGALRALVKVVPVNQLAVLLMVYLSLRHIDQRLPSRGAMARLWHVLCYALRRWLSILSIVGIWLYIYLQVLVEEVQIPNIGSSRFLYIWFWRKREACLRPEHWIPSVFLMHEVSHAYESPCHNLDIFEACFQVDVLVTAAVLLLPRPLGVLVSAVALVPALGLCNQEDSPKPRSLDYLPVGLFTMFCCQLLPRKLQSRTLRSLLWLLAGLGFAASAWLLTLELPREALDGRIKLVPWILPQMPMFLSVILLLRLSENQLQGHGWSPLAALGRLCGQINITHLFVLQLHRGFAVRKDGISSDFIPLPGSCGLFGSIVLGLFLSSAVIALVIYLVLEAPMQALLLRRAPEGDVSNGHSNGHVTNGHR